MDINGKTARSGLWLFRGALREGDVFSSLLASCDWVKKGSYHTAWSVPPLSACSCSYSYGQGPAVGPQTGERCWSLLTGLWRAVAPLMKPWCAEGVLPTAAIVNARTRSFIAHTRGLATLVVVVVPSTCQDSHLTGCQELARGHRCGPQGSHWVWEVTPSPVQLVMVNMHPSRARCRTPRTPHRVRLHDHESAMETPGTGVDTAHCGYGAVSSKTTTLITVKAASAATAFTSERKSR